MIRVCLILISWVLLMAVSDLQAESETQLGEKFFQNQIKPLLQKHCLDCHGPQTQEADLRIDNLNLDFVNGPDGETWHDVLNKLNLGEMPPEDAAEIPESERNKIVTWLNAEIKRASQIRRSTGGQIVLRRLTRYEYQNTMRDLLGIDLDFAADLPPESKSADGFKNNGSVLAMSPLQLEYYLQTARYAISKVIVSGDQPELVHVQKTTSEKVRKRGIKVSDHLVKGTQFIFSSKEFPREGDFVIRVKAYAIIPEGTGIPVLQANLGVKADVQSPSKMVGQVDITADESAPQTIEFTGRMEEFPLPGKNPKFPGVKIELSNVYHEFALNNAQIKKKKNEQKNVAQPEIVIQSAELIASDYSQWPPKHHQQIFFDSPLKQDEAQYSAEVIHRFMTRAFRREVTTQEAKLYHQFYQQLRDKGQTMEAAMREALALVLISPDFLYLVEPAASNREAAKVDDFELASRLSYFLWSTMPDDQLFELAKVNKLHEPQILQQQVKRMLEDDRIENFVQHFTSQWLNLSGLEKIAINPEYYPSFDHRLKNDMRQETQHFFQHILQNNLSSLNFLHADFTMLNHRLAKHYGIAGPASNEFKKVQLSADDRRGGLLTQGSTLLINSTGEDSHPIKRGVWVRERLLDDPPAPPPPDVPTLDELEVDLAKLPVKQQLEMHRNKAACNSCHRGIDPWGIPFENYDAIGQWRDEITRIEKKKMVKAEVETSATLPSGEQVENLEQLKKYLLEHKKDQFAKALVSKITSYGLGRSLEFTDELEITRLTNKFQANDYRLQNLMVDIVNSPLFLSK